MPELEPVPEAITPPPAEPLAMPMLRPMKENLSGTRKAAILCIALGDEVAGELFKHLSEDEMHQISKELVSIRSITPVIMHEVLEEFHNLYTARAYCSSGGFEYAKRLLIKSLGPENAKRMLDRIATSLESKVGFEALRKCDPQQLSKLLLNEHPQTIAVVFAHLDPSTAADTLAYLPEGMRADLVLRVARLQSISHDVIRRVSLVLDQKLKNFGNFSQQAIGGVRKVADLCNRLDRDIARDLLSEIVLQDSDLALSIRNLMVTFDDLLLVDDLGIREILRRVDKKVVALSLKGSLPEIQTRFFSNMSARAVELMKEEMEFMGQVKMKDVTAAQRQIVDVLRELDEQGVIALTGGGDVYIS